MLKIMADNEITDPIISASLVVTMIAISVDERTEGIKRTSREKVPKLSNDELFYDPDMDEDDERWVQRQRMAYHNGM